MLINGLDIGIFHPSAGEIVAVGDGAFCCGSPPAAGAGGRSTAAKPIEDDREHAVAEFGFHCCRSAAIQVEVISARLDAGKHHNSALCHIATTLLTRIVACWRTGRP